MNWSFQSILIAAFVFTSSQSFHSPHEGIATPTRNNSSIFSSGNERCFLGETSRFHPSATFEIKAGYKVPMNQEVIEPVVFSSCFSAEMDDDVEETTTTTLIVLNYPIPKKSLLFRHLWDSSSIRIAADGGANRIHEFSKDLIPDVIRGDLDSLDPAVQAHYEAQKVSVEQDSCQDTNDLDKAIKFLVDSTVGGVMKKNRVIIYGAFGGRFDQEMANFAALFKWTHIFHGQLYLYSDETCAFLIPAKTNCEIRLPFYGSQTVENQSSHNALDTGEGPTCGMIPLGCPCKSVITSGLKWDLDGATPLEFGGLVSTSNRIMEPIVKIFSSHPLVFTAELLSRKRNCLKKF